MSWKQGGESDSPICPMKRGCKSPTSLFSPWGLTRSGWGSGYSCGLGRSVGLWGGGSSFPHPTKPNTREVRSELNHKAWFVYVRAYSGLQGTRTDMLAHTHTPWHTLKTMTHTMTHIHFISGVIHVLLVYISTLQCDAMPSLSHHANQACEH